MFLFDYSLGIYILIIDGIMVSLVIMHCISILLMIFCLNELNGCCRPCSYQNQKKILGESLILFFGLTPYIKQRRLADTQMKFFTGQMFVIQRNVQKQNIKPLAYIATENQCTQSWARNLFFLKNKLSGMDGRFSYFDELLIYIFKYFIICCTYNKFI